MPNELLMGYMQTLIKIATHLRLEDVIEERTDKLVGYVITSCLLNIETPNKIKFKSKELRLLALTFINLFEYDKAGYRLGQELKKIMERGSWRKQDEWAISPTQLVKKRFTGLKNLSATCYINSLLQQLLYIGIFSDQIIGVDADKVDDKENIVLEIQNIFGYLRYTESPSITTLPLCKQFIIDGQPIDPRNQTDVDEFFHSLIDKLERNLSNIGKKEIISNLFGGEIANLIVGNDCEHTS